MKNSAWIYFCAVAFFLLLGCGPLPRDIDGVQEVKGTYMRHMDGFAMEMVILHEDMTFEHYAYADGRDYHSGKPPRDAVYANKGIWHYKGNTIYFEPWQMMCDIEKPDTLHLNYYGNRNLTWLQPGSCGYNGALLLIYDEPMYVFERLN